MLKQLFMVSLDLNTISLSSCKSLKYDKGKPFRIVSIENKFPKLVPDFPLRYSSRSGFFF